MSLLARLRDRTRTHHDAVERELGLLDRPWTAYQYRALLRRFLGYYDPLEGRIEAAADWPHLGFDWPRRRKVPLVLRDLWSAGDTPEVVAGLPRCLDLPGVGGLPQALGCLYVLEGATLGGRVITRHLSAVPGLVGFSFFSSYGDEVGPMWRAFGEFLTARAGGDDEAVVVAACETFTTLRQWLRGGESGWVREVLDAPSVPGEERLPSVPNTHLGGANE
jgi:heme oxygenase